ncbi:Tumor necrosis factor receptor type 1-associated DEATH domain protein [Frankliniella fusca]|uniref:Tumor necrosis factor receptor type 1-associated DEATH domain protein n=1 Tax=Frankliniella fusca TaxID=407009 RepID=A0AAE1LPI6_9NEOP|nr:Tumor necrosis factor receptor type 1-associated DEATH domain protein [Frankliniella fusca]
MKKMITAIPREILNDLQYNLIDVKLHQRNVLNRSDFILLNSYSSNEEKVEMLMELMRNKTEEDHENFLEIMEEDYSWLRDKCEIFFQKIRLDSLLKKSNSCTARSLSEKPESPEEKEQPETTEESDRSVQRSSSPDSCVILPGTDKENVPSLHVPPHNKKSENQVGPDMEIFNKKLDQAITSDMMTKVRRNHRVVKRWSTLAHALGMTRVVHTLRMRIIINGEDVDACVLHLLEEWKGTHPKEATLGRLVSALREDGFNDVADELVTTYAA